MVINEPRCDYIRLTTYDKTQYEKMAQIAVDISDGEEPEKGNFLQYQGDWYSHTFHGQGEQRGYSHWLMQVSGELSQFAMGWLVAEVKPQEVRCTRLDLQVTVPLPASWDLRLHVDTLREASWPNRRRKVEFYENEGEGGTIYIGSRQSDKFARIYVKFSGHDEWPLCIRYEIELKGDISDVVFKTLQVDAASPTQLLRGEFNRLPIIESDTWLAFERAMPANGMPILVAKNLPDENKTIRWLIHKVTPTIKRMLSSHEHGPRTYQWLKDLCEYYERQQK